MPIFSVHKVPLSGYSSFLKDPAFGAAIDVDNRLTRKDKNKDKRILSKEKAKSNKNRYKNNDMIKKRYESK